MSENHVLAGLRLSVRQARFELLFLGGLIVAVVVAAFLVADRLEAIAPPAICFEPYDELRLPPVGCDEASRAFYELQGQFGGPLLGLLVGLPLLAGAMLGVTLVARELERGTARLAWSLSPSRVRWYLARLLPMLALFAAVTFLAGIGADRLEGAIRPGKDMATSFDAFGSRGVLVAARAVFVLAIAVAVGAVMGRILPALLVTAVIAAVGISGGSTVHQTILRGEAIVLDDFDWSGGDMYVDQRFRLPDGNLVGWEYFEGGEPPYREDGTSIYPEVAIGVPGERYGFAQARELGALGGASAAFLLVGLLVSNRRRPE